MIKSKKILTLSFLIAISACSLFPQPNTLNKDNAKIKEIKIYNQNQQDLELINKYRKNISKNSINLSNSLLSRGIRKSFNIKAIEDFTKGTVTYTDVSVKKVEDLGDTVRVKYSGTLNIDGLVTESKTSADGLTTTYHAKPWMSQELYTSISPAICSKPIVSDKFTVGGCAGLNAPECVFTSPVTSVAYPILEDYIDFSKTSIIKGINTYELNSALKLDFDASNISQEVVLGVTSVNGNNTDNPSLLLNVGSRTADKTKIEITGMGKTFTLNSCTDYVTDLTTDTKPEWKIPSDLQKGTYEAKAYMSDNTSVFSNKINITVIDSNDPVPSPPPPPICNLPPPNTCQSNTSVVIIIKPRPVPTPTPTACPKTSDIAGLPDVYPPCPTAPTPTPPIIIDPDPSATPTPLPTPTSTATIDPNPTPVPSGTNNPNPTPTATIVPTPVPSGSVNPTPPPSTDDNPVIALNYSIVSTTESEKDDDRMIANLENSLDNADRYAMNGFSVASFGIKANKGKFNINEYINRFTDKFNTFLYAHEGKILKKYNQIKDKQVFIKHIVYIHNFSKETKEGSISGEIEMKNISSRRYARRFFGWSGVIAAGDTKKVIIKDNNNLVWYGRDEEILEPYISTANTRTRFGPYLAENGEYTCKVDQATVRVSPGFLLVEPTKTPTSFNTFKIVSEYTDYVRNGVPKEPEMAHIKERHKIEYLNQNQVSFFSSEFLTFATDSRAICKENINDRKKQEKLKNTYNKFRNKIISDDSYDSIELTKSPSCFPLGSSDLEIKNYAKSLGNLEELNDTWGKFSTENNKPRAVITGIRNGINMEARVDNPTFGGLGGIATAFPIRDTSISQEERKEKVLRYYIDLVSDGNFEVTVEYLKNYSPHTTRLLALVNN